VVGCGGASAEGQLAAKPRLASYLSEQRPLAGDPGFANLGHPI